MIVGPEFHPQLQLIQTISFWGYALLTPAIVTVVVIFGWLLPKE